MTKISCLVFSVWTLTRRVVELGIGVSSARQIHRVTGDAESEAFAGQVRDILLRG